MEGLSTFPYEYRTGQLEMSLAMHEAVENGNVILAHAPTGIGKSICSLSAATQSALQDDKDDKDDKHILFLTNRRNQARIVLQETRKIEEKTKKDIRCTAIQSRRSLCPLVREQKTKERMEYAEFIDSCRDAKKLGNCPYWSKMRRRGREKYDEAWTEEAILVGLATSGLMPEEAYQQVTARGMCTYEALKIAAEKSTILIARYIHAFDPEIRGFFLENIFSTEDCITIVDEAHNLADDIAKHYSIQITERMIDDASTELQNLRTMKTESENTLTLLNKLRDTLWRLCEPNKEILVKRWELTCGYHLNEIEQRIRTMQELGDKIKNQKKEDEEKSISKSFVHSIAEKWAKILKPDKRFIPVAFMKVTKYGRKYPVIELRCIDAKDTISDTIETFQSTILMSATLTPLEYYKQILGVPDHRAETLEYPPVFPQKNRRIIVDVGATSQYNYRDEDMYNKIATYVQEIIKATPGPGIFFYPSYTFLKTIIQRLRLPAGRIWSEHPQSTIDQFIENKKQDTTLHAVSSGKFAEGIDVPSYFKAATSIGIPLATWNEIIAEKISYYNELYPYKGRLYAYEIPAINKIIQSTGRAIRTPHDKAVIIAIDSRLGKRYRGYLPRHWRDEMIVTADPYQVSDRIKEFWEEQE